MVLPDTPRVVRKWSPGGISVSMVVIHGTGWLGRRWVSVAESDALFPRSSADALHDVLYAVKNPRAQTMTDAWSKIFGAQWGSLEFALRHGEVVSLWTDVVHEIHA